MSDNLIIEGVDLSLLEKQRKDLIALERKLSRGKWPTDEQVKSLKCVIDMLDAWSDEAYDKKVGR